MTREQFLMGLKVFWSCGGTKEDKETLEVWFRMLKDISPEDFEKAIMDICRNRKELSGFSFNFVAEVLERAKAYKKERRGLEWKKQLVKETETIPIEDLRKFLADFKKKLEAK